MVIVEAMACGLPVVAFDCPWGPRSIINDGENGLLAENGDPSALAKGILFLANDPALCVRMGTSAKQDVQRYSLEHVAVQWKQLFDFL